MLQNIPIYITIIFVLTTVATLLLFIRAVKDSNAESTRMKAKSIFVGFMIWLILQAILALNNIYNSDTHSFSPKIILFGILPAMFIIILLFATAKGRQFIDNLPLKNLTYLNVIRIPVELVLFWLSLHKVVPELMTFEGRNFDILAGITAPIIGYLYFSKYKIGRNVILIWNFISLGLLMNIVINALLSAPSPIQRFAFDQPNLAILNFPFCWLPTFIVPIVLFGHLVSIKRLVNKKLFTKNLTAG
jgi:hypothetical protein